VELAAFLNKVNIYVYSDKNKLGATLLEQLQKNSITIQALNKLSQPAISFIFSPHNISLLDYLSIMRDEDIHAINDMLPEKLALISQDPSLLLFFKLEDINELSIPVLQGYITNPCMKNLFKLVDKNPQYLEESTGFWRKKEFCPKPIKIPSIFNSYSNEVL
jgi:hypothetical protein